MRKLIFALLCCSLSYGAEISYRDSAILKALKNGDDFISFKLAKDLCDKIKSPFACLYIGALEYYSIEYKGSGTNKLNIACDAGFQKACDTLMDKIFPSNEREICDYIIATDELCKAFNR